MIFIGAKLTKFREFRATLRKNVPIGLDHLQDNRAEARFDRKTLTNRIYVIRDRPLKLLIVT
jgi:hypothetical protein